MKALFILLIIIGVLTSIIGLCLAGKDFLPMFFVYIIVISLILTGTNFT